MTIINQHQVTSSASNKSLQRIRATITTLAVTACLWVSGPVTAAELYHNFTGYTLTSEPGETAQLQSFQAMLVEDGRIVAIGGEELVADHSDAEQINLHGRMVLPGLIDAHGHVQGLGQNLVEVDLRGLSSLARSVAEVTNYADKNLELSWIVGRGWNQEIWPNRSFPTKEALDRVISDRPVWLTRVDAHAGWANSKALELAGITAETEDPEGGEIIRDEQGEPTGILIDTAMDLVEQVMPSPTSEQLVSALHEAQAHLAALGITQVHDAGVSPQVLELFKQMQQNGELKVRINAMIDGSIPELADILAQGVYQSDDAKLRIGNVKLYGDGALGSRGARLIEPYSDRENAVGLLVTPENRVASLFEQVHEAGFQISYHAIGDYTNRLALDEFEQLASNEEAGDLGAYRHRIEHAQVVQLGDIPRFKTLGIIPSMQPTHATSDKNMAEDRVGSERIAGAYAWRTFLAQGSLVAGGSDFPVELANPFYGIHAAVTRQDRDNQPVEGWYPEQAMSLVEALRSFTLDAAYAGFMDEQLGSLETGKAADFIVVDKDIFAIDSKDLWRVNVLSTYVHGERIYHAQP